MKKKEIPRESWKSNLGHGNGEFIQIKKAKKREKFFSICGYMIKQKDKNNSISQKARINGLKLFLSYTFRCI